MTERVIKGLYMKRLLKIAALFLAVLSASLLIVSCADKNDDDGKLSVVCTTFAPYDFVRAIAGDTANVQMLVTPGADTHSYDPTPRDIVAISKCDIFVYIGGDSDAWVDRILSSVDNPDMKIIKLIDCTEELYYEEHKEGMDDVHDDKEEYDEHVFTSPRNASLICDRIADTLLAVEPENEEFYRKNLSEYKAELESLDEAFKSVVENGKRKEIVFADRFPLLYFVKAYGLDYYAAFPGCSSETEPSGATVAFLIKKVKEDNIPVVFYLELSDGRIADTICESTGAEKIRFNSCHNVSKSDFEAGKTYLSLMRENVALLEKALG